MTCKAIQQSDEMFCAECGLRWDVNDPEPPQCRTIPKRIVAFTGLAGSGKTTAALHLAVKAGYAPISFAAPIKAMLHAYLSEIGVNPVTIGQMLTDRGRKEAETFFLNGHSPRYAMQTLGTEWARQHLGDDFWINAAAFRIDSAPSHKNWVFDDVRFENEARMIRKSGGVVIRIERPGLSQDRHASEGGVEPDMTCYNSGSEGDMRKWLDHHVLKKPEPTTFR